MQKVLQSTSFNQVTSAVYVLHICKCAEFYIIFVKMQFCIHHHTYGKESFKWSMQLLCYIAKFPHIYPGWMKFYFPTKYVWKFSGNNLHVFQFLNALTVVSIPVNLKDKFMKNSLMNLLKKYKKSRIYELSLGFEWQ